MLDLITAIIKPHKLDDVKAALLAAGVEGMTVSEVTGFGRQRGKTENFRGSEYTIDFIPKLKVEVVVNADDSDRLIGVIADAAKTGKIGDGKIWITEVARLVRIRTGEAGADALGPAVRLSEGGPVGPVPPLLIPPCRQPGGSPAGNAWISAR